MSVLADVGHLLVYDQKSKKKLVQIKKNVIYLHRYLCLTVAIRRVVT